MTDFSKRLEKAMALKNMKQSELCEKTGIGKSSLSQYLSGLYKPKQDKIHKIAKVLDVDPLWLMGITDADFMAEHNIPELGSASHDFSDQRTQRMLEITNYAYCLSDEGQEKVIEYLKDLYSSDKYKIKEVRQRFIDGSD